MSRFVKVATRSEIPEGVGHCVEVEGKRIAIFCVGGRYFAIDEECTHQGGPLSEGLVEGEEVECSWHGARFNLRTGRNTGPPAEDDVASYEVRVVGDEIEIQV